MKRFFLTAILALIPLHASADTPESSPATAARPRGADAVDARLATPPGHDVTASLSHYLYREPGAPGISIHGAKFEGAYTGTRSFGPSRRAFIQGGVRGTVGNVTYDGWCSPFLISPNSQSPNGYELDLGDFSSCSETGDRDWYVEGRALVGTNLVGRTWAWSPFGGLGIRHLSNGTTGTANYRTDDYFYVPLGVTVRTGSSSRSAPSVTLEFDRLIHGRQKTRDSELGSGPVPPTATAPSFTIDGFTDIAFRQSQGWALRASAKYPVGPHWHVEPYFIHWNVSASRVNTETVTFTVNAITAKEQLGAYEPDNLTNEFGLRLGFHF